MPAGTGGDLIDASSSITDDALVVPSQIFEQITIEQEVLNRVYNSTTAVMEAFGYKIENSLNAANTRSLISAIYGGNNLGTTDTDVVKVGTVNGTVSISLATIAADIWTSLQGATIQFRISSSNASVASGAVFTVSAVNIGARTFTVTAAEADIDLLVTATSAPCYFVFQTAYGNEQLGLQALNESTAAYFSNIDPANSPFYRGQSLSASSGSLNLELILRGAGLLRNMKVRGNVRLIMPHKQWEKLNNDEAALVRHTDPSAKDKAVNGFNELGYAYGSGNIILTSTGLVKNGHAFMYPEGKVTRLCSRDWRLDPTDGAPESASTKWLTLRYGNTAAFGRLSTGQQLFTPYLGQTLQITSIV